MQPVAWRTKWAKRGERQKRVKEEEDISGEQMWEPEREREEQRRDRQRETDKTRSCHMTGIDCRQD